MTSETSNESAMEMMPPPPPISVPGMPIKPSAPELERLRAKVDRSRYFGWLPPRPSIALAAARFSESCVGGGYFLNNCAHYLANAFVLAGFDELTHPHDFVEARCYRKERTPESPSPGCDPAAKRLIRARELEKWFQKKAVLRRDLSRTQGGTVQERYRSIKNTGFWAVFQVDTAPGSYWGGHACIIDTDNWRYFGTGSDGYWYWHMQHCYQW